MKAAGRITLTLVESWGQRREPEIGSIVGSSDGKQWTERVWSHGEKFQGQYAGSGIVVCVEPEAKDQN